MTGKIEPLTLSTLECHFNWKPEVDSTKVDKVDYVIRKTKNKLKRSPHAAVAHRCTLAYLYAVTKKDFNKAYSYLENLETSPDIGNAKPPERYLACEFIVKANRLKLDEFENQQQSLVLTTNSEEKLKQLAEDVKSLENLWQDSKTRAAVFAIKGITFSCFGPKKYDVAISAYETALELVDDDPVACNAWHKFDWLWGLGLTLSRVTRTFFRRDPTVKELDVWNQARHWMDSRKLNVYDPMFYANFAQTVLHSEKELCSALMEKAVRFWDQLDDDQKVFNSSVVLVWFKVCPKYPKTKLKDAFLWDDILKYLGNDADIYIRLSKLMNYHDGNEKAIKILELGKEKSNNPSHLWLELNLLNRYAVSKDDGWIKREYTGLLSRHQCYSKEVSEILLDRSKWAFYKHVFTNRFNMSENWEHFDQCFDDLVQAKKLFSGVFVGPDLLGKLLAVFSILQTERPECLAWFYSNLCVMNIDQRYQSVIDDPQSSEERRRFAKENLGLHYLQQGDFQKAAALFRDLAHSNTACKKYFAQSVIQNEHRSIDDLVECLEVDNCDAAHIILEQFEMAKNAQEVDKALLKRNISTVVHKELFFTRYHFETCAKIELVFEKSDRFFLESGLEKDEELVKKVSDRINNFLGMTSEPWDWKRRRLVLSKLKMTMDCQETVDEATRKELAVKSWDVLHRARMALDDCISEFFQVKKSIYPHAYNKMTEKERKMLLKKAGSRENYEKQREPYLTKRLKEEWLPQNGETKLKYEVIEGLLREAFGAFKGKKVPEDVLKFVARREHHIITKEAAWHVAWVENDNLYKHNITAWHLGKVEEQLNEYRDITGLFNGEHVTAYDAAHWAAEFAEQTCIISKHNSNTMRRNSSDF